MKKGSIGNHQFSQDWNDLKLACALRINPYIGECSTSFLDIPVLLPTHEITDLMFKIKILDPRLKILTTYFMIPDLFHNSFTLFTWGSTIHFLDSQLSP